MTAPVISVVWLLSMLAAIALAARPVSRLTGVLPAAAAFAVSFALLALGPPQPGSVGAIAALAAAWRLLQPGSAAVDRALGGLCAGACAALHAACGLPPWLAVALAAGTLGLGVLLLGGPRPAAPPPAQAEARRGVESGAGRGAEAGAAAVRDGLLFLAAVAAAVAGTAPDIIDGWRSAALLNPAVAAAVTVPAWVPVLAAVLLLAGVLRGAWSRR